jgi:hypothetical protein
MRTVGIWASGLLAWAIPFIFVGAVIAFSACVFDAQGKHAPARSGQAEAATPELVLAVAPGDIAQRQPHAHGDRRHHHAGRSGFRSHVRHRPLQFGFGPFANHFANQFPNMGRYRRDFEGMLRPRP